MTTQEKGFDSEGFYRGLQDTLTARKTTWSQVSRDTGISPTTLTRMAQGRKPDASSLAALSAWAGLNPADYVVGVPRSERAEPLVAVTTYFRADPNLSKEAAEALSAMIQVAYDRLRSDGERNK